jgi:predicted nuclease with TOPRIM domain
MQEDHMGQPLDIGLLGVRPLWRGMVDIVTIEEDFEMVKGGLAEGENWFEAERGTDEEKNTEARKWWQERFDALSRLRDVISFEKQQGAAWADEVERLRAALEDIDDSVESWTWIPERQEIRNIARQALEDTT